jgi:hypothetical protein
MGHFDDLQELERQEPRELERMRRIRKALVPESEKPDRLRDYRDQRLNRPDGPGSYEPELV